jgi:hypothetical protein
MVPMLAMTSSRLIPMPVSATVNVLAAESLSIQISSLSSGPISSGLLSASIRKRSSASDAFEIISLRKISLFV